MQFWPRKRAVRQYTRVRSWANISENKLLGFAGYKAGMTQIKYTDAKKTSLTKGLDIVTPVTIIECPPMKVYGARAYSKTIYGDNVVAENYSNLSSDLSRKLSNPKKKSSVSTLEEVDKSIIHRVMLVCHTQPKLTGIGKKKPEIFEVAIGGSIDEQLSFALSHIGKEIAVSDVFDGGFFVDIHAVTTGRGYQGVVKRFGVTLKSQKSEKGQRRVGARSGGWKAQAHMMYRVAQPGQQGYHTRTEYNKKIMAVDSDLAKVAIKGGIRGFGEVRNSYILVHGSIAGPKKRLVRITRAIRCKCENEPAPLIDLISLESHQG